MKKMIGLWFVAALLIPSFAGAKVGGGDIAFHPAGAANVTFSHDIHLGKLGLKCKECHYQVFTTVAGHKKATMTDMQKGRSCGACHNGTRAFDVKGHCGQCHL